MAPRGSKAHPLTLNQSGAASSESESTAVTKGQAVINLLTKKDTRMPGSCNRERRPLLDETGANRSYVAMIVRTTAPEHNSDQG